MRERTTTPIIALLGTPQKPSGEKKPLPGRYSDDIAGTEISQPCAQVDGGGQRKGFTELLLVVKVGEPGVDVQDAWIDYLADGDEYRLQLGGRMAACGHALAEREEDSENC